MIALHILGSLYTADLDIEKLGTNRKILRLFPSFLIYKSAV